MIDYFRRHLGAKLFISYLAIIVVGVTVLIFTSQSVLPTSFNRHMLGMGNGDDEQWNGDGDGRAGLWKLGHNGAAL